MSRYRRAAKVDDNQSAIVDALRQIPGVSVIPGHDDILVGHRDTDGIPRTYWYEVKSKRVLKKDGTLKSCALQDSQVNLKNGWSGHYRIVITLEEILGDLGIGG